MIRFSILFLFTLCLLAPAPRLAWAETDQSQQTYASFVSRFLDMLRDKIAVNANSQGPLDPSRRNFLLTTGGAAVGVSLGRISGLSEGLTQMGDFSKPPKQWLLKIARLRGSGAPLEESGLDAYIAALEKEMDITHSPQLRDLLLRRIGQARQTLYKLWETVDPMGVPAKDIMSIRDTRADPREITNNPIRRSRLRQKLEAQRESLLKDSRAQSNIIEALLTVETLLTPIIRNRMNAQIAYTAPKKQEFVIALDGEDIQVVRKYYLLLKDLSIQVSAYPASTPKKQDYLRFLEQRRHFTREVIRAFIASKRAITCDSLLGPTLP